ncbi:MAG: aminomethyl-transferring glycine dehydrogenase subunit GcvPA [Planctomycetes bacterium]|nr:aminomethyl-transferring glycine dehydrogenase subunit GcvPA [Planctomycetota bacterium]
MPFIQNTDEDRKAMLDAIGVASIDELYSDIPADIRVKEDGDKIRLNPSMGELEVTRHIDALLKKTRNANDFAFFRGAGIYNHHVSTLTDHIALYDGNFITAYTPYQPECSQGTLTTVFEFQSCTTALTGFEVSNAGMYDGASALAEAVMMGYRLTADKFRKETRETVVLAGAIHPEYAGTVKTYCETTGLKLVTVGAGPDGRVDADALKQAMSREVAVVAVQSPNFFGVIEDVESLVATTHENEANIVQVIAEPVSLSLLQTPAEAGVDICVGEGQAIGNHMFMGGPAFGFFASRKENVRKMPGRIVSETTDRDGRRAFALALATREQHIRREKATSNICTNQALCALRALIQLAAWGKGGFLELGKQIISKTQYARQTFGAIMGVELLYAESPVFNEFVIRTKAGLDKALQAQGIMGGIPLEDICMGEPGDYLIAITELTTKADIDSYASALADLLQTSDHGGKE